VSPRRLATAAPAAPALSPRRLAAAALTALATLGAAAPATAAPPAVTAPSAILVEPQTGDVLVHKNARERRPIASATKLMTALLVLERVSLDDTFTAVPYSAAPPESRINLRAGERMKVRDLLRALLLESANDAAATLAVGTAGSREAFVHAMNERARALGLRDTSFANPIGFDDPANRSTAADLVRLARRLRANPFFRRTVALRAARLHTGTRPRVVDNRNDLVGAQPWVDGVKTGHTTGAGYVLVGSATRGGVTVLSAVLGDPSQAARDADTLALLRYGLSQYRRVAILRPDRVVAGAKVKYRDEDRIELVPARPLVRVLRRGERPVVSVSAPRELKGPMPRGAVAGSVTVRLRGRVAARVPLVTAQPVPKVSLAERAVDLVLKPGTLALVLLAAVAAAVAVTAARRRRRAREEVPAK
jgi:D-alanyl-D-alanine carboxypeptidase (penicillin-binding protein 5/6)